MHRIFGSINVRFGRIALAFVLFLLLGSIACESDRGRAMPGPADSGAVSDAPGADTPAADPRCAPNPYTGHACGEEALGASCVGAVSCACGLNLDDFRSFPTQCVCEEGGAFGRAYACEDECMVLCGSMTDAGTDGGAADASAQTDASPPSACQSYCDLAAEEDCPISDCVAGCEEQSTSDCGAEWNAFMACTLTAPVECFGDAVLAPTEGCDAEQEALFACGT